MSSDEVLKRLSQVLLDARAAIDRGQSGLAIQYLGRVAKEIEGYEKTQLWLEHRLLLARAYAQQYDPVAESFFEEVRNSIPAVPSCPVEFQLELCEQFAGFYSQFGKRTKARSLLEEAKNVSVAQGNAEETNRIQLRLVLVDLKADEDVEVENFNLMMGVAAVGGYTYGERYLAWHLHLGNVSNGNQGHAFKGKAFRATEKYFGELLATARATSGEDETQ